MAAQKGLDMLIKMDISGTLTIIGGLRSTSLTMSDESVDITNKDSQGTRALLAGGGVNSIAISGSGVFTDVDSETKLRIAYDLQKNTAANGSTAQTPAFETFQFVIPSLGAYAGLFMISSIEYAGEYNGEVTYSLSFESAGHITFTAG